MRPLLTTALFATLASPAAAEPVKGLENIGDCVRTKIASIGPRLEGSTIDDSGVAITYVNGAYGVAYQGGDQEPWRSLAKEVQDAVLASRIGDTVKLCLESIPENCPKGDDRGREYAAYNFRTHRAWKLPDAEHMCGGA
jgi:hypothetical protein